MSELEQIKQLEDKIQNMQFQLDDVKNTRDPLRANQRIDLLEQKLEAFGVRITEMDKKIEAFGSDSKFIEIFTNEEFIFVDILLMSEIIINNPSQRIYPIHICLRPRCSSYRR